jgi:hypothetical protein
MKYSQTFNLLPVPGAAAGNYYLLNDMFRLNYC